MFTYLRVSALERRDRETEVEMQNIREMGAEKLMVMKQKGRCRTLEINRSREVNCNNCLRL